MKQWYICRVFLQQPLEIDEFIAEAKNAGLKIASKDVIDFLDEQVMIVVFNSIENISCIWCMNASCEC